MRHIEEYLEVVRRDIVDGCAILGFSPNMPRYMSDAVAQAREEDIERLGIVARYHSGDVLKAYNEALSARSESR